MRERNSMMHNATSHYLYQHLQRIELYIVYFTVTSTFYDRKLLLGKTVKISKLS